MWRGTRSAHLTTREVAHSGGPDTGRKYAHTLAEVRKGMWPGPVYEAHFGDGTIGRMSFWSRDGRPFDFNRGRLVCSKVTTAHGKTITDGFVEHNGDRLRDPMFTDGEAGVNGSSLPASPAPAKRRNGKELEAALQALVDKLPLCLTEDARRVLGKAA